MNFLSDDRRTRFRLFVIEGIVLAPGTPHRTKQSDTAMMVHLGGRERTRSEYVDLLEESGWLPVDIHGDESDQLRGIEATLDDVDPS